MKKENLENNVDFNPTMEELINELAGLNTKLMIENISLKISLNKLINKTLPSKEESVDF